MTLSNIFSMIMLALLDSLNPANIATMLIVLPLVKKKWHSLLFVVGTFTVNLSAGFLVFAGVDRYLKVIFAEILRNFSIYFGISALAIACTMIGFGTLQGYKLVKRLIKKERKQSQIDHLAPIANMVKPSGLIGLSVLSTLTDLPTAIPYFGFIGILIASNTNNMIAIVLFVLYCLTYVSPMIALYLMFAFIKGRRFNKIETTFRSFINEASEYVLPIMLILFGAFLLIEGVGRI